MLSLIFMSVTALAQRQWQEEQTIVIIKKTAAAAYSVCLEYKKDIPQCSFWRQRKYQCFCNQTDHKIAYLTIYRLIETNIDAEYPLPN